MEHSQKRLFFKKTGVTDSTAKEAGSCRAGEDKALSILGTNGVSFYDGRQSFVVFGNSFPCPLIES